MYVRSIHKLKIVTMYEASCAGVILEILLNSF